MLGGVCWIQLQVFLLCIEVVYGYGRGIAPLEKRGVVGLIGVGRVYRVVVLKLRKGGVPA